MAMSANELYDTILDCGISHTPETSLYVEQALEVFVGQRFDAEKFMDEILSAGSWTPADEQRIRSVVSTFDGLQIYSVPHAKVKPSLEVANALEIASFLNEYPDLTFRYRLLSRMQSDCEYYLGNGNRSSRHLWAGDEQKHIAYMKAIWNNFSPDKKPEWLSFEDILDYEHKMVHEKAPLHTQIGAASARATTAHPSSVSKEKIPEAEL